MIKNYLTAILLVITIYSYSQENKNKFMINGNAQYSDQYMIKKINHSNNTIGKYSDSYKNSHGAINFGYFLSNNFAIGISGSVNSSISYSRREDNKKYLSEYTDNNIEKGCGIFARYNHILDSSKFGFFFQLGTHYYWGTMKTTSPTMDSQGNIITIKRTTTHTQLLALLNPGIVYFINNKFSVESALGSIYYTSDESEPTDTNTVEKNSKLGFDFNLTTISLGFSYYFGGKKA
jgi:hypothetical protein